MAGISRYAPNNKNKYNKILAYIETFIYNRKCQ